MISLQGESRDQRAGVVHEDVDRSQLGRGLLDQRADLSLVPHVALDGDRRAACRDDPIARVFRSLLIAVIRDADARAEVGERRRRRCPDARGRSRDERDAAGEIEVGFHAPYCVRGGGDRQNRAVRRARRTRSSQTEKRSQRRRNGEGIELS